MFFPWLTLASYSGLRFPCMGTCGATLQAAVTGEVVARLGTVDNAKSGPTTRVLWKQWKELRLGHRSASRSCETVLLKIPANQWLPGSKRKVLGLAQFPL